MQLDALRNEGCELIFQEHASGKNAARVELDNCLRALRAGDTLIVWRMDRLGRSLADLVQIVQTLEQRGVGFVSLTESIDTGSASGKLIFHFFSAISEFERNLLRERTNAGIKAARARGRNGGRPAKLSKKDIEMVRGLLDAGDIMIKDIAAKFGVSRATLYRAVSK